MEPLLAAVKCEVKHTYPTFEDSIIPHDYLCILALLNGMVSRTCILYLAMMPNTKLS